MKAMEESYPGFTADDDGLTMKNPEAGETVRRWMTTPGMGGVGNRP